MLACNKVRARTINTHTYVYLSAKYVSAHISFVWKLLFLRRDFFISRKNKSFFSPFISFLYKSLVFLFYFLKIIFTIGVFVDWRLTWILFHRSRPLQPKQILPWTISALSLISSNNCWPKHVNFFSQLWYLIHIWAVESRIASASNQESVSASVDRSSCERSSCFKFVRGSLLCHVVK